MLKEYKSEIVELIHLNNHLVGQLSNAQDDIERHNKKSEIKFVETQSIEKIRLAMVCLKNETSSEYTANMRDSASNAHSELDWYKEQSLLKRLGYRVPGSHQSQKIASLKQKIKTSLSRDKDQKTITYMHAQAEILENKMNELSSTQNAIAIEPQDNQQIDPILLPEQQTADTEICLNAGNTALARRYNKGRDTDSGYLTENEQLEPKVPKHDINHTHKAARKK